MSNAVKRVRAIADGPLGDDLHRTSLELERAALALARVTPGPAILRQDAWRDLRRAARSYGDAAGAYHRALDAASGIGGAR